MPHDNALPFYKMYPRDFFEGTAGMSFEVKGAYAILLNLLYLQKGKLPDDSRYISGNLGLSVRKWNSIRKELLATEKIKIDGDFLTNNRVSEEVEKQRNRNRRKSLSEDKREIISGLSQDKREIIDDFRSTRFNENNDLDTFPARAYSPSDSDSYPRGKNLVSLYRGDGGKQFCDFDENSDDENF